MQIEKRYKDGALKRGDKKEIAKEKAAGSSEMGGNPREGVSGKPGEERESRRREQPAVSTC